MEENLLKNFKRFAYTYKTSLLLKDMGLNLNETTSREKGLEVLKLMAFIAVKYRSPLIKKGAPLTAEEVFSMIPFAEKKFMEENGDFARAQVSCKSGCGACCNLRVSMSDEEVPALEKYIKDNNIQFSKERMEKQKSVSSAQWYTKLKREERTCPFLDKETQSCKVYEARPASCRLQFVATPAEDCEKIDKNNGVGQVMYLHLPEAEILMSLALMLSSSEEKNIASAMSHLL